MFFIIPQRPYKLIDRVCISLRRVFSGIVIAFLLAKRGNLPANNA